MVNKTGYFTHPDCWKHEMGQGHPECPERLDAIHDRLISSGLDVALEQRQPPLASLEDIALAHDTDYVASIHDLNLRLQQKIAAGGRGYAQIDPDTAMNAHTWHAIMRSAGAAIAATDAVMLGSAAGGVDNAFCAVRPPGHHATRGRSMGFCFFNQVAIGVKYAMEEYGLTRVAVVVVTTAVFLTAGATLAKSWRKNSRWR